MKSHLRRKREASFVGLGFALSVCSGRLCSLEVFDWREFPYPKTCSFVGSERSMIPFLFLIQDQEDCSKEHM